MKLKFKIMKQNKLFIFLILFTVGVFSSCTKESADISSTTDYPVFTVTGAGEIIHQLGTPFVEPGVKAVEGTTEITVTTSVEGIYTGFSGSAVDENVADKYEITYSAENKDGFSGSAFRTVYVVNNGDLINSIEGIYRATVTRNGSLTAQYTDMEYVVIWKTGANTYEISDCIGGYYDLGRGYGPGYMAAGMSITANDISTNNFSFGAGVAVGAFGGDCAMDFMTVDAANKAIQFQSTWDAGYTFLVDLKQVSF